MNELWPSIEGTLSTYSLATAFAFVGIVVWFSYFVSRHVTRGRMHGSAIAILTGLLLAYVGGVATSGKKGIADIECLA
ncbi:MAG: malonate transporter subunit MadM, partial [Planctomycetales bacterium]|nr:malonate transporter subunit MadM [Planctomycetales bacterium]